MMKNKTGERGRTVTHEDVWYEKDAITGADEKLERRVCQWDGFSPRDAYQYEK
jgi:hypothetical protein